MPYGRPAPPPWWCFALGDNTSVITASATAIKTPYFRALTIQDVYASVKTVSSAGTPTFDIHVNGVSIFSTLLTIDANQNTSLNATTPFVFTGGAAGIIVPDAAKIEFFITVAGTGAVEPYVYLQVDI